MHPKITRPHEPNEPPSCSTKYLVVYQDLTDNTSRISDSNVGTRIRFLYEYTFRGSHQQTSMVVVADYMPPHYFKSVVGQLWLYQLNRQLTQQAWLRNPQRSVFLQKLIQLACGHWCCSSPKLQTAEVSVRTCSLNCRQAWWSDQSFMFKVF